MQESSTKALYSVGENETCLTAVLDNNKRRPKLALFTRPKNFEWVSVTSEEFIAEVMAVAKGLIANGVEHGDRVALLSETRYEWTVMDFAIWAAGAVTVPIYGSSSASQIQWIIEDSGAVFAITETREHTELMRFLELGQDGKPRLKGSPTKLRRILEFNSSALDTLAFEGRDISDDAVWERIHSTKSSDLASLVYTSGTTGRPKGCCLTHSNWLSEVRSLLTHDIGRIARPGMRYITFLPLAHVFARAVSLAVLISGAQQSHWSDFSTINVEFQRAQPNLILGVPRVFEKVRNGVHDQLSSKGPLGKLLFARAESTAIQYSLSLDGDGPSSFLKWRRALYDRLLYRKIRAAMGGAVQYSISGGSAMNPELLHFFRGMGSTVYEGYGLTETTAAFAVNFTDNIIGTVGRPSGGCAARIADNGELCLKGPVLFDGYWNNEEATNECFDEDGYFHTGDLGEILDSGHIKITGREKELLVTAGGKNVSPGPIEDRMRSHPLISQVMLVGDGQPFIGCLVTLDEVALEKWKRDHGVNDNVSNRELHANPVLRAEIQDAINDANSTVSHAEAVKKFHILDRDFTEEEGELTATLKVKRHVVMQHFARDIANLYQK
ncbi:long-chain fatty acid--CoA ligase [Corynebacterium kroppenstedtii]|uniref:AMP-dependent synthetase/ligase n=1 Tax=Corynebacterium pseudokroppenstedtii TaxID=2804917 RepID=UPI00195025A9|nr:long-chain fatty acid--CoA ligase [Corynebacterium pseudokroppenstedtii]MDK7147309.1 long-chain fatty acid--CoA ligase [Corynebacterium pseudokroppenstedtii]QRP13764.1 long-chain fatty acid--CoA ligase [Corynebacterium kroppenstedtii]